MTLDFNQLIMQFPIFGISGVVAWYLYNEIKLLNTEVKQMAIKTTEIVDSNTEALKELKEVILTRLR